MPQQKATLTLDHRQIPGESWQQPSSVSPESITHCEHTPRSTPKIESLTDLWGHLAVRNEIQPSSEFSCESGEHPMAQFESDSWFDCPMTPRAPYEALRNEYQYPALQDNGNDSNESPRGIWDHPSVYKESTYQLHNTELLAIPTLKETSDVNTQSQEIRLPTIRLRPRHTKFYSMAS